MGLYGDKGAGADHILKLTPAVVLLNLLGMIRSRHPRLGKFITAVVPIVVVGFAGAKLFGHDNPAVSMVKHVQSALMATITVPDGRPLLGSIKKFKVSQGMTSNARRMTLKSDKMQQAIVIYPNRPCNGEDQKKNSRNLLECQPDEGTYYYRFEGQLLTLHVHQKKVEQSNTEGKSSKGVRHSSDVWQVSISCFSVFAGPCSCAETPQAY